MSDENDLYIGKDIDADYIGVEKRRADVSVSREDDSESDNIQRDRQAAHHPGGAHVFDTANGSGSASKIEELIDQNAIIEHDGRASTRTFFRTVEAPADDRAQYERMIQWQEDMWSGMKNEQRAADRRRMIETFCSALGMSTYHKDRVKRIIDSMNMSHMAHYSSPKVILSAITLVANEDNRFIRDEKRFKKLVRDAEADMYEIKRIRYLIRDKSDIV